MNIPELYKLYIRYPKVCIDSRKATKGSLFFALKGEKFDGNKFVQNALKYSEYAIVDDKDLQENSRCIYVENVLKCLQDLSAYHRKKLDIPILAITGTNGKTTTKELIAAVLSKKYSVAFTQGNLNNHIGVPLTLLSFSDKHKLGIVEMGANHVGEIELLCKIATPNFGIITNVGKAHLEGFGSFEQVKKAKGELYKYLRENKGTAFINYDNEFLEDMMPPQMLVYYGTKGFTHCQGRLELGNMFLSLRWISSEKDDIRNIDWEKDTELVKTQLIGNYNFENVLAALCVGSYFEIPTSLINEAIESYVPKNNRSQCYNTKQNTIIVDSYNANPSSMKVALENFKDIQADNKMVILGDMFELGRVSDLEHRVLLGMLRQLKLKNVILVGETFFKLKGEDGFVFLLTTNDLIFYLKENKIENKLILLKGSRGMKLESSLEYL